MLPLTYPACRQARRAFALAPLALFCSLVFAADAPSSVEQIVISGSRVATPLRNTPAAVGRVSLTTLRGLKATFIGEALDQIPGVYMTDLGNEQHSMAIRMPISTNAYYVYLEDGVLIRPVGIFNHNALYEVNLGGNAAVEVVKGPASSLYGSNAVGGAVNFLTRAPASEADYQASLQLSDRGYRRLDVGLSATTGDWGWRGSAYHASSNGGDDDYNGFDKTGATLRLDYPLAGGKLSSVFSHNHLRTDMPGSLSPSSYLNRPGFSNQTFTWRQVDASRLSTSWTGSLNTGGESSVTLFLRDNDTRQLPSYLIFNTGPTSASGRQNDNHFHSVGLDLRQKQDVGNLRLIGGLTFDRSPNQYNEQNLAVVRDALSGKYTRYSVGSTRRDYEVILGNRAAYLQAEWQWQPTLRLVGGLRYDQIEYDYHNRLTPSTTTGAPSETRRFSRASPKVGLVWNLDSQLDGFINASQGFTPPEVSSLYGSLDTPNLQPAIYDNLELGMRGRATHWQWEASLYRLAGRDEQVSYSLAPGKSEPRNAGRTLHQGLELGLSWQVADALKLRASAAWSSHRYREYRLGNQLDYAGRSMPQAPEVMANLEMIWQPQENSRLSLEAQHMGPWWMDNANSIRYGGHTVWNLRASQQLGAWELWAKVKNLADRRYAESASSSFSGVGARSPESQDSYVAGAGRSFFLGLAYRFR
ncbi:TonB-dependent receptor family protein [Parachitinimonas caeni]|uniref:TonB-dependent receptor n=1 Tax=Parachitinimonas caeni TaxID=3031301 RepID=A0ABT7E3I6_9NEIS|nr:TonB-dependent receptor [Parachitinimonas caeni]MDK2125888.1 TonB-dependent receptor [Parachitinimonas caeni]